MGLRDDVNRVFGERVAADAVFSALATRVAVVHHRHPRGGAHHLRAAGLDQRHAGGLYGRRGICAGAGIFSLAPR